MLRVSRERWAQFWKSPAAKAVHVESDLPRLRRWIQASDEYERAAKAVRESLLAEGSTGQQVLHPLVAYLAHLDGVITRAEGEFGMTPMARHKLRLEEDIPAEEDVVDQLRARRAARHSAG